VTARKTTSVTAFAGKGGVGKTTCAAAAALHSASVGQKTLAISTDATPSLAHIFETAAGSGPVCVTDNLYFSEIGVGEARRMWESKFGRDVFQVFSSFVDIGYDDFADFMASVLPGLAEEFMVDYIRELAETGGYDIIIWDTAPLGQTLALLATPALLTRHLRLAPRIYASLKAGTGTKEPILNIIGRWEDLSAADMRFLCNDVDFNIVAIAEALSVNQLDGIFAELNKYRFKAGRLIINNVISSADSGFLQQKAALQSGYLETVRNRYGHLKIVELPLFPHEVKGLENLRRIAEILY
jgi:arsenite-transporting ATPase